MALGVTEIRPVRMCRTLANSPAHPPPHSLTPLREVRIPTNGAMYEITWQSAEQPTAVQTSDFHPTADAAPVIVHSACLPFRRDFNALCQTLPHSTDPHRISARSATGADAADSHRRHEQPHRTWEFARLLAPCPDSFCRTAARARGSVERSRMVVAHAEFDRRITTLGELPEAAQGRGIATKDYLRAPPPPP